MRALAVLGRAVEFPQRLLVGQCQPRTIEGQQTEAAKTQPVAMLAFELGLVIPIIETTARPIGEMRCATGSGHDKLVLRFVGEAITARLIAGDADKNHVITPDLVPTIIQEQPSVDSLRAVATVIGKCREWIRYVAKDKQCAAIPCSVSAGHINEHRAKFGFHRFEELLMTVCNVASRRRTPLSFVTPPNHKNAAVIITHIEICYGFRRDRLLGRPEKLITFLMVGFGDSYGFPSMWTRT